MKKRILIIGTLMVLLLLLIGPIGSVGAQPTEADIEASIVAGLSYLAGHQNGNGSWGGSCQTVATTGLVVLKFETRAYELGFDDPTDEAYEYHSQVAGGLGYLAANILPHAEGYYFSECGHEIYNTGIAMMALSASSDPAMIPFVQGMVDFMAWAQADPGCGVHRGGWRYAPNLCDSDNSNAGYATLGLGFAQAAPPFGFGLTVPQAVKDELGTYWIKAIQDPVNGDANDGGSHYTPGGGWVNILKTGNLLYEMGLVGDDKDTPRVQDAVDYIERTWYNASVDPGWRNHRQAMFTMMKGLESLGIEMLDLDGDNVPETVWFDEVAQHLIDTQNADGSWPSDYWGGPLLSTAWALLTLEKTVPVFEIPVSFDVHPGSCPNPLNVDKKGVTPVAIAGTDMLDVYQIDPASLRLQASLEGDAAQVAPLRWAYEDAAVPVDPYLGRELDRYFCLYYDEGDGYMDLTVKFATQEVASLVEGASDGDVILLYITGNLQEDFGGTPIVGEDVVWIIAK